MDSHKSMSILLANPPCRIPIDSKCERFFIRAGSRWPFSIRKNPREMPDYVPFPFYLAYSAALLEREGFIVFVLDAIALNLSLNQFLENITRLNPHLILFETSTPTVDYDLNTVKEIKRSSSSRIVLTGPHVTVFPKEIMELSKDLDFIIRGEYELSFLALAKELSDNNSEDLGHIKGLVYRKNGEIKINSNNEIIDPLDQLPYPAYHLFPANNQNDLDLYWDGFIQYKPTVQMHASRGCPFKCNFCLWNQVIYSNGKYRMFSPERVVDEMEYLISRYKVREIYFDDDDFTANKKHVLAICKEIKERRLKIYWSCMGDAMITDEEMVEAMADSGCIGMKFGVESGNKDILRYINKPIDFDRVKKVARYCAQKKVKTHATFTFGLSGETRESMLQTLNLAKDLDVDSVQFSITTPFPGTKYYADLKKRNLINTKNWSDFDGANKFVVNYHESLKKDIEKLIQRVSGIWLRNKLTKPHWVVRQGYNLLRMIKGQGVRAFLKRLGKAAQTILSTIR